MERDLKCMYCAEAGITNTDVFIEIVDVELGAGWICKECFIESEKEKDEHLKELEQQLQAKEQECERTKERLESFQKDYSKLYQVVENKGYIKELDQLKAENEELKKISCKFKDYCTCDTEKFKQTLTEIKEIAEKMKKLSEEDGGELTECFFKDKQCEKCSEDKCLPYWFEQILQKISEVIE